MSLERSRRDRSLFRGARSTMQVLASRENRVRSKISRRVIDIPCQLCIYSHTCSSSGPSAPAVAVAAALEDDVVEVPPRFLEPFASLTAFEGL